MAALRERLRRSAASLGPEIRTFSARLVRRLDRFCDAVHDRAVSSKGRLFMGVESLIIFILIGAIAGWLAGQLVKGYGFGLLGNIVVGIVGAFIAGLLFPAIGISLGGGILAAIIHATIGAVILLVLIRLIKQA
jgi:uncharacterized membrane protein YeaQ/YmgE (transglycosylase-associated protein family)